MSSALEDLRQTVELLKESYDHAKEGLNREYPDVDPLDVRDSWGRYILMESLMELIRAQNLLIEAERLQ